MINLLGRLITYYISTTNFLQMKAQSKSLHAIQKVELAFIVVIL